MALIIIYGLLKGQLVNPLVAIVAIDLAKWEFWCFFYVKKFIYCVQLVHIDTAIIQELFKKYSIFFGTVWWLIDTAIG